MSTGRPRRSWGIMDRCGPSSPRAGRSSSVSRRRPDPDSARASCRPGRCAGARPPPAGNPRDGPWTPETSVHFVSGQLVRALPDRGSPVPRESVEAGEHLHVEDPAGEEGRGQHLAKVRRGAEHLGAALGVVDGQPQGQGRGGGEDPAEVVPERAPVDLAAQQADPAIPGRCRSPGAPRTPGRTKRARRAGWRGRRPRTPPGRRRSREPTRARAARLRPSPGSRAGRRRSRDRATRHRRSSGRRASRPGSRRSRSRIGLSPRAGKTSGTPRRPVARPRCSRARRERRRADGRSAPESGRTSA